MASAKRSHIEIDPDYEDVSEQQTKRQRILEEGAKEATKLKIESIIKSQFDMEIENKESETVTISERLEVARNVMDKLRACIVASYYANASQQKAARKAFQDQPPMIHPSVKRHIGKAPPGTPLLKDNSGLLQVKQEPGELIMPKKEITEIGSERIGQMCNDNESGTSDAPPTHPSTDQSDSRTGRFKMKKRIIVGNVSKSIPADQRDENDQATHKWMVYVRGPKEEPRIDGFVKKVWFFLHPSYRPNDLVEVSQPPFHLTRRGWGEFPVRVQLHFKDHRNKRLDIIHNLKLDRTYTGLQTLGAETVVEIDIERDVKEVKREKKSKDSNRTCNHGQTIVTQIKQEPSDTNEYSSATFGSVGSSEIPDIKTEPIDHDYGQAAACKTSQQPCLRQTSDCVTSTAKVVNQSRAGLVQMLVSPTQTIVNPSVLTTQAVPLVSVSKTIHSQVLSTSSGLGHLKGNTPTGSIQSVVQATSHKQSDILSPERNIVLQAVNSISGKKSHQQNQNVKLSSGNFVLTGSQPLFLSSTSGNNLVLQSNLQQSSNTVQSNKVIGNPSQNNAGLVLLRCVDSQGKAYLIPQQVCTSPVQSPQKGGNVVNPVRVGTPVSQPVLLTNICPTGASAGTRMIINQTISPNKLKQQKIVTPGSVTKISDLTNQAKPVLQNGPLLFIKPDVNASKASQKSMLVSPTTPNKSQQGTNLQIVRNIHPAQATSILNMKQSSQTVPLISGNQGGKGQLKVTSQGLIHVASHQPSGSVVVTKADKLTTKTMVNGDFAVPNITSTPKQPIVLVPNNNKLTLIPGKTKSLLSPVTNLTVSQSNGNVILLNQTSPVLANGNSNVTLTTAPMGNKLFGVQSGKQNTAKVNAGSSDMIVLQTKGKTLNSQPNHVVIIPVTSEQTVSMATKGHVTTTQSTVKATMSSNQNNVSAVKKISDQKPGENTMLVVVQNDKTKNVAMTTTKSTPTSSDLSLSSLLVSKSSVPLISLPPRFSEKQVSVSTCNSKSKHILFVNDNSTKLAQDRWSTFDSHPEKKLITDAKKRKHLKEPPHFKEIIKPLSIKDHCDMISLIRASVQRHPIISATAGRHLHPYCARSNSEWLTWNLGKRRASEWQRASCVRKFILSYLEGETVYKGETIWTVKQILTWCRLHAYSPHYLEKPLHPTAIDLQSESSLPTDKRHRKFQSVSNSNTVLQEVAVLQDDKIQLDSSDDEIDITSEDLPRSVKVKTEIKDQPLVENVEYLPVSEEAEFVEEFNKQIGIKMEPVQVEPGTYGKPAHDTLYKCMELFMEEILRETFALQVNMGRYPDAIGIADVFTALNKLPTADFITNKYLGVEENQSAPTAHR